MKKMGTTFGPSTAAIILLCAVISASASANLSNPCTAIVCSFDCVSEQFPAGIPIYPNISTAFAEASPSCGSQSGLNDSSVPFRLILQSRGDYPYVRLPAWLYRLNISVYSSPNTSIPYRMPLLGAILRSQTSAFLQLALDHVDWTSNVEPGDLCFNIGSFGANSGLEVNDSVIRCKVHAEQFSRLVLSDTSLPCYTGGNCDQQNFTSYSDADFRLTRVSSQRSLYFALESSSTLHVLNSTFSRQVSVVLQSETAMVTLRNSSFGHVVIEGPAPSATLLDNTFDTVTVDGKFLDVDIQGNIFSPPLSGVVSPTSLLLMTGCDATGRLLRNRFKSGTFYLYIPTDHHRKDVGCPSVGPMYRNLTVRVNQFEAVFHGNASASIMFDWTQRIPTAPYASQQIDFTNNWWGDAAGPKLCCNPKSNGSFPTQLISPNQWCLDPECNSFSTVSLPTKCLVSCCTQPDSKPTVVVLVLFGIIAYVALLASLIYTFIYIKMHFASEAFKYARQEDMVDKIVPPLLVGIAASTAGAISIIIIACVVCSTYWTVPSLPRQEKYNLWGVFIGFIFCSCSALQLIANGLIFSSVLLRRKYPKYLRFVASKVFIWCGLNIAYMLVASLVWLPYGRILPKPCSMVDYVDAYNISFFWFTSFPTPKLTLLTVVLIPSGLMSFTLIAPLQTLNDMLYNFEYMRINSALETALLKDLAQSPTILKKAWYVRVAASFTLLLAFGDIAVSAYLIAKPIAAPVEASYWPISILVWGVPRFINTVAACLIGVLVLAVVIWLTFSYNRATILRIVTFMTLSVGIAIVDSNFSEFPAYAMLQRDKSNAFVLHGAPQALGDLFGIGCLVTFFFLYRLSKSVAFELPKIAISNLNAHLDEAWSGGSQTYGLSAPLLSDHDSTGLYSD